MSSNPTPTRTAVVISNRFVDHVTPPGHPERVERAETMQVVARQWEDSGGRILMPRAATREELARVHSARHVERVAATAGQAVALDPDTCTSPDSYDVALLAAGAAVTATEWVMETPTGRVGYSFARPPGHHAERDRVMGFCLFNNVAVAAAHALTLGLERVAIVDYDVHHGNGTQEIFYGDPRVLYISTHQYPYYPGTGAAGETGEGAGAGFTLNAPLEAGATDGDYDLVFRRAIRPILDRFDPQLLFISAGFDADARDPLAGMRMSTAGFAALTRMLRDVAAAHCGGRLVLVAEGGYHLQALAEGLTATLDVVAGLRDVPNDSGLGIRDWGLEGARAGRGDRSAGAFSPRETERPPDAAADPSTRRAEAALDAVRAAQRPFWGEI